MVLESFFAGYIGQLENLAFYVVAVSAYALVVGFLYQTLSKKNLFDLPDRPGLADDMLWLVKYVVAFPVTTFLFFLLLSSFLFLLGQGQTTPQILLISMTIVAATRLTAYINEGAAVDLAKLLPLALLGVFIVDPNFFVLDIPVGRLTEMAGMSDLVIRYFGFVVVLELGLRVLYTAGRGVGLIPAPEDGEESA